MKRLAGALLAGGKSRRMGTDKCLLEVEGAPLWRRAWGLLGEVAGERFVVAPQRPEWCGDDMRWLADEEGGGGPLGGVAAALQASQEEWVLALAVDLPDMTADYLRGLRESGAGVVPEMDGLLQPLSAIYPKAALPFVREHLEQRDVSLQSLLGELIERGLMKRVEVSAGERALFRNLNRPGD